MKFITAIALSLILLGCGPNTPTTTQGSLDAATHALAVATNDLERFYPLCDAAKDSFDIGAYTNAENYAKELLVLAPKFTSNWNYGNAIHDGNMVLGRIALKEGRIDDAKARLLAAANTTGSPTLNSFGPNVSLAKDLLEKGETDTALEYFNCCRKFWRGDFGKLDQWTKDIKEGRAPDFGANLVY